MTLVAIFVVLVLFYSLVSGRSERTIVAAPIVFTGAGVAVPYEGLWFWIERRNLAPKTTLSVVTTCFNFLEAGSSRASPGADHSHQLRNRT